MEGEVVRVLPDALAAVPEGLAVHRQAQELPQPLLLGHPLLAVGVASEQGVVHAGRAEPDDLASAVAEDVRALLELALDPTA
eukprot:10680720-Alexandrium_andersonii.AAC.1